MFYSVYLLVRVKFITQPSNLTVCSGDFAVFTCEVDIDGSDITAARWEILSQDNGFVFVSNLPFRNNMTNHMHEDTLTSRLTITNITSDDNGTTYRCRITDQVTSYTAQLIVAGMYVQHAFLYHNMLVQYLYPNVIIL